MTAARIIAAALGTVVLLCVAVLLLSRRDWD